MNVIAKAEKLIAGGALDEARELLLTKGYVEASNEAIQAQYEEIVPPSEELIEHLGSKGLIAALKKKDAKLRSGAADRIGREARREWANRRRDWLADPRTTGPLIQCLTDANDKVVLEAVCALRFIFERYFADLRAFDRVLPLLKSPKKAVRAHALSAIAALQHADRWELVASMMEDPAAEVRVGVCGAVLGYSGKSKIAAATKAKLKQGITAMLKDKDEDVRDYAGGALKALKKK